MTFRSEKLLSAAREYASRGWPVFPVMPRGKTPLTKSGFKEASTDRNTILGWWQLFPNANIGIPTGITFDVLDVDGLEGVTSLLKIDSQYHHAGPMSRTGRGYHLLFAPTGSGNKAGMRPKLDYRGSGGFIVAPPSTHPSGTEYFWQPERGPETPLPEAPQWLLDLLGPPPSAKPVILGDVANGIVQVNGAALLRRDRPDILMVANSLGYSVEKHGQFWKIVCPFHEDHNPSLVLYPYPKNNFYCYSCNAYGDSYDLADGKTSDGRRAR